MQHYLTSRLNVFLYLVLVFGGIVGCREKPDSTAGGSRLCRVARGHQALCANDSGEVKQFSKSKVLPARPPMPKKRGYDSVTSDEAVAFLLATLLGEYGLHPEKDLVEWFAQISKWARIPSWMAAALNSTAAYTGPVAGHRLMIFNGKHRSVFMIYANDGFTRDGFLKAMNKYCNVRIVSASKGLIQLDEIGVVSTEHNEFGIIVLGTPTISLGSGAGTVLFMPSDEVKGLLGRDVIEWLR